MKKVVSPSEVCHLFANQVQDHARNQGNTLYFHGDTLYSYGRHFAIAKHVENKDGEKAVLFTMRSYSNTTAKHIRHARYALNHKTLIECSDPEGTHSDNINYWVCSIELAGQKLAKARKPEIYLNAIADLKNQAQKYMDFFGLKASDFPYFEMVCKIDSAEQYAQYFDAAKAKAIELKKKAAAEAKKAHKKALKEWRNFKTYTLHTRAENCDYLRYSVATSEVQTSQGVCMPEAEAKRILALYLKAIESGGCTECEGKVLHRYEIKSMTEAGLTVGCHFITRKEIEQFKALMKW